MNSRYCALIAMFVITFASANDELEAFIKKLDDNSNKQSEMIDLYRKAKFVFAECEMGRDPEMRCLNASTDIGRLMKQAHRDDEAEFSKIVESNKKLAIQMLSQQCTTHINTYENIENGKRMDNITLSELLIYQIGLCCSVSAALNKSKSELAKQESVYTNNWLYKRLFDPQSASLHTFRNRVEQSSIGQRFGYGH